MTVANNSKQQPTKKQWNKLTVTRAARVLQVDRAHLSRVIHGKVNSPRLAACYTELLAVHSQPKTK